MTLPERAEPTHILTIEVPMRVDEDQMPSYDVFKQALKIAVSASRAAFDGYICDDVQVSVDKR